MIQDKNYLHLLGGVDVDSRRYGKPPHINAQSPNVQRDEEEFEAVNKYFAAGLPILGVCRGAQLLCVAAGGELWQHSLGHHSSHALGVKEGFIPHCDAGHHQIMKLDNLPSEEYKVLAWCPFTTTVYDEDNKPHLLEAAPEVVWFPSLNALAIQPHPEWAEIGSPFRVYADELVAKYITGKVDKNFFEFPHSYG